MSHGFHRHGRFCHPERSEGPVYFFGSRHNYIGPFGKLRAGSSRKERAQDDKEILAGAVR
jgi:hypothetical protein